VALLCFSAAAVATYVGMAGFRADDGATLDNRQYTAMALGHSRLVPQPFHYRIVVPGVVRLLPSLSHDPVRAAQLGFAAADLVALTVAGVALHLLLRTWRATPMLALVGVLGFYLSHTVLRFGTVPLIESSAYAVVILVMLAAERRLHVALVVLVLVGMFVKETTAIALLYPLVMSGALSQRLRLAACALPGVLAYVAYRVVEPVSSGYTYGVTDWAHNLSSLLSVHSASTWRTIILAFGPWWILMAIGLYRRTGLVPNRYAWLVLACAVAPLVLTTDYERVLFLGFPVVLGLSLPTLARALDSSSETPATAALVVPEGPG
jgi:xanthosine utilization system XapX-like protein